MPGSRLTLTERELIQAGRKDGMSARAIAKELGRSHTTVTREVVRNSSVRNAYRANVAQHRADRRARRPKSFKLERHRRLRRWVERKLHKRWSPEQIAQRLRKDHPDDPRWWVSVEAIYGAVYVQARGEMKQDLTRHLRRGRSKRRHGPELRGRIKDVVLIADRPAEADDRAVPGHWEGDLLLGTQSKSQVGLLVERTTRYALLFRLPDRSAVTTAAALGDVIRKLPAELRRSLTWDQGHELAHHADITLATDMQIFFCDPASPWQKGLAENTVGLVRQYLPRNEDLSIYTQKQLDAIARELNERPRKTLDWDTPAEAYAKLLAGATAA
jgi:IS30 family transposase